MTHDNQKTEEGTRISNEMKAYTAPALAAVYAAVSQDSGVLLGSGTFLRLRDRTYLLTAQHVVVEGQKYQGLFHTTRSGTKPAQFRYDFITAPNPIDLALGRIDNELIEEHGIRPWGVEALASAATEFERDVLFTHGYPGEKSKWLPIVNGGIHSTSMPFWTSGGRTDWTAFDERAHIAIMYPRDGWFDENNHPIPMPFPDGLSGSALWQTNRRPPATRDTWSTQQSRIIGLIHRWDMDAASLVATKIEVVREFLLHALRQEAAHESWLERGSPPADDRRDWDRAVREIPDLS